MSELTTGSSAASEGGSASRAGTAGTPEPRLTRPSAPARAADAHSGQELVAAGFVSRTIAMTIDLAVIALIVLGGGGFVELVGQVLPQWAPLRGAIPEVIAAVLAVVPYLYFAAAIAITGSTLGKALMGMRVVSKSGGKLSAVRAIVRTLGYLVSACFLFAGFLWVLVDGERRAWHDHLAGSRVVHVARDPRA